jgi:hypothetical protein
MPCFLPLQEENRDMWARLLSFFFHINDTGAADPNNGRGG